MCISYYKPADIAQKTWCIVMGRTPFCRTSNKLVHDFSNIEGTQTCLSIGNQTRTPYFWLQKIAHRTSNLIGLLLNYSSNSLECVRLMVIELEHPIFGFERSNIKLWTSFDPSVLSRFESVLSLFAFNNLVFNQSIMISWSFFFSSLWPTLIL